MTALTRRLIGAPTPTPLALAVDRLHGLSANPNARWTLWHGRHGWMIRRQDTFTGETIDRYGPYLCPQSAAFHAECLEAEWSRWGDPVYW